MSKPPKGADLIEARVVRERAWAYDAWMARLSWWQIRRLANLPEDEGGLGYDLSEGAIKGLVEGAKADRGDLTMSRADRIERQAAEVDERARSARHDFAAAYARAAALDEAIAGYKVMGDTDRATALARMVDKRAAVAADLERADKRLDAVHAREARLFGLDVEAKLEVTHVDSTDKAIADLARELDKSAKRG